MRKIEDAVVIEQKGQRNRLILGALLIGLMLLSTAGYAFYGVTGSSDAIEQTNGVRYQDGYWIVPKTYSLLYLFSDPATLNESYALNQTAITYANSPLLVDSENSFVTDHLRLNLQSYFPSIKEACNGACVRDLPEKDCSQLFIVYKESQTHTIRQEQQCFFIEGNEQTVDSFLLNFVP